MKAQWNVPANRPLADFAPTIILKAKDFAAEITIFNAREHGMQSEAAISQEHIANNQAVLTREMAKVQTAIEMQNVTLAGIRDDLKEHNHQTSQLVNALISQSRA